MKSQSQLAPLYWGEEEEEWEEAAPGQTEDNYDEYFNDGFNDEELEEVFAETLSHPAEPRIQTPNNVISQVADTGSEDLFSGAVSTLPQTYTPGLEQEEKMIEGLTKAAKYAKGLGGRLRNKVLGLDELDDN